MKIRILALIFSLLLTMSCSIDVLAQTEIYGSMDIMNNFDFEYNTHGWSIPEWTDGREDYVGRYIVLSDKEASKNHLSLKVMCKFPRALWAAALVEYRPEHIIKGKNTISADIFLPAKARGSGFKARLIITLNKNGQVLESNAVSLQSKKWNKVSIYVNSRFKIKKIAVRVEREATSWDKKRRYKGPIYIDNIMIN